MMSKKDFDGIAKAFAETRPNKRYLTLTQWGVVRAAIVEVLRASNPHFNEARFIAATLA